MTGTQFSRFRKHFFKLNTDIMKFYPKSPLLVMSEVVSLYKKAKGCCQFCGSTIYLVGPGAFIFQWYIPLEYGGKASIGNVVVVCSTHERELTERKRPQDVFGINTFADLCEQLFLAVQDKSTERIKQIKRMMNWTLEDIAATLRYKTFDDWKPEKFELIYEGRNTIPDLIEKIVKEPETKEDITEQIKQIVTSKKYRVLRNE